MGKLKHGNIKIDEEILTSAIQQGLPKWKAAQMAGSKAKTRVALTVAANQVLQKRKTANPDLIERLKAKEDLVLEAMSNEKANNETFRSLTAAFGIINERRRLLEGKSTENHAIVVRWEDGTTMQTEKAD